MRRLRGMAWAAGCLPALLVGAGGCAGDEVPATITTTVTASPTETKSEPVDTGQPAGRRTPLPCPSGGGDSVPAPCPSLERTEIPLPAITVPQPSGTTDPETPTPSVSEPEAIPETAAP